MSGWIKLSRKFFENPFWSEDRKFSKCEAWLDLIQTARFEQSSVIVNGKVIELQRGELCASIRYLAKRWSWGEQMVRTYLKLLVDLKQTTHRITQGQTVITICNYAKYNDKDDGNNTEPTQSQHRANTEPTQNKRIKELKNEINKKNNNPEIVDVVDAGKYDKVVDDYFQSQKESTPQTQKMEVDQQTTNLEPTETVTEPKYIPRQGKELQNWIDYYRDYFKIRQTTAENLCMQFGFNKDDKGLMNPLWKAFRVFLNDRNENPVYDSKTNKLIQWQNDTHFLNDFKSWLKHIDVSKYNYKRPQDRIIGQQ